MFIGCPMCNGVEPLGQCPYCGNKMEDLGMVDDFLGPYHPYQDRNSGKCMHLIYCPNCQWDYRREVEITSTQVH